ncbi:MAG TPA: peptidoglycan-binding domain-containing protein [Pyrinomonadaceae bacterium]|nr:peptidoglycan-binding domain-containing protein [Pyrinomonadaceae bacterium]
MFIIKRGEHSPRVVLLQIMLNRQGAELTVDGIFGRRTRAAVVSFQASKHRTTTGVMDPATWAELAAGTSEALVDVVDIGDPMLATREAAELRQAGSNPIELGGMCNGITQMVNDVIRRADSTGPIALLRITGHGNLGRWMTVSVGDVAHLHGQEYEVIAGEYFSYIDLDHFDEVSPILGRLKPYFASFGSMEHLGCSIGSRPNSRKMMKKLSDLWSVPVSAGIPTQLHVLHFDGAVFTAYPDGGTLSGWSRKFRNVCL